MSSLLTERLEYKPFWYPWAFLAWERQQQIHWMPGDIPMHDDVQDWAKNLTPAEKNLLTQILRFFTTADVEVNNCYMQHYSRIFKPTEILMMLAAFSNMETIHVAAYSHLLDTVGMPVVEYSAFMQYEEMRAKFDYMRTFNSQDKASIALTMAAFGGFTEGLQLYASFAMLLSFPRFGRMKGMGQIISYSVRDETLHCLSVIKLFHQFLNENPEIATPEFWRTVRVACQTIVGHEDKFIDLAFEMGDIQGLTSAEMHVYIRYIADRRLVQLGMEPMYGITVNPLPWIDLMMDGLEHTNFFENKATAYTRSATAGTWEDAFADDIWNPVP